jgi:DNA primase catalytic core
LTAFFEKQPKLMLIDKAEIERVKRAHELVGFIRSRGVALRQRGKQLVGLCSFHDDHEPSLVVDAKKQLWNCLGACHEGGDVYRFVMKAEGVDFREAHRRLGGHEAETKSVSVAEQQWLERAVDHYHARLLETPAAQDYLRSRGITAVEFVTSFRVGYADGRLAEKLPAEGRKALRRVGVLTGSGRELLRGCVVFPLVAAGGANSGHVVGLYGRSIEGRRHLYLPGERRGVFNPQGVRNTDEVIITESVIDAAALWGAGLRNVIPVYGVTGLTEEIIAHLVECRVKRVVLMLDADDAGRTAVIDMAQRLAAVNIETCSVELPAKDAAEFVAGGGLVDDLRRLITESAASTCADASAARAMCAETSGAAALPGAMM